MSDGAIVPIDTSKLTRGEKVDLICMLLADGYTQTEVGARLGMAQQHVSDFIHRTPVAELRQAMFSAIDHDAIAHCGMAYRKLRELMNSKNAETSRKAALNVLEFAGKNLDAIKNLTVNMNGKNNQLNISAQELQERAVEIARVLGPDAVKLIEQKGISIERVDGRVRAGAAAGGSAEAARPDPFAPGDDQRRKPA